MQSIIDKAKVSALMNQRNHAQNECVTLAAQIAVYDAQVKDLQAQIEELKANKTPPDTDGK